MKEFIKIIYLLLILFICEIEILLAQKKSIDFNAYANWSSVGSGSISSNGKYVFYNVENTPEGNKTLFVLSTQNSWKRSFKASKQQILLNTKGKDYAVILNENDSLWIISLGKDLIKCVPNVSSVSACRSGESEWIAYQSKRQQKELIFQNLTTGMIYAYNGVINKVIGDDGQTVILQTERKRDDKTLQELNWIDLKTGNSTLIWKGPKAERIVLDVRHHQLAFTSEKGVLFYNITMRKLNCVIDSQLTLFDSGLRLGGIKRFSQDGKRLFVDLKEGEKPKPIAGAVEIWSYLDSKLQSQQEHEIGARSFAAVVNLMDGKIIRLEKEFENLSSDPFKDGSSDTVGLITQRANFNGDWYNKNSQSYYLISLKDGKRVHLKYSPEGMSPSGKYVVYFDPDRHTYMSYHIKTGAVINISQTFLENLSYSEGFTGRSFQRRSIAGWLENDEYVLFYDNYDIWRMDLSGKKAPVNLTAGYGRIHNLAFSIIDGQFNSQSIRNNQKIVLVAFDVKSKKNGFYSLELDKKERPKLLSMGDYFYCAPWGLKTENGGFYPIKAKDAEFYLVKRMSAKESPNYFITRDFKTFRPISNVYPERDYNWYTTELHTWVSLDGGSLQGILYKPENFDPSKKYPVIFHYYEGKSNNLNAYIKPEILSGCCNIDIPTYVNNGYLVFTPDIVYKIGDPMQGTYDAVVSAAKYIGALSFVDSTKMGIQGCSWGGIQTNYLVTRTNLFAAACSSSGIADWIANYGRLFVGIPLNGMYEFGQFRMGRSVWEIPDAYVRNSPIFQLDKVTTPFLIMHTKKDLICSYDDAIALFTGLRRLGKKSWLLAYPDENHGISDVIKADDFSIRMMQFFDHYLKDKPSPIWMTTPTPAGKRGLVNDLLYDTEIKTPGPGLLTIEEQKKVDSMMVRKPIIIELK